MWRGRDPFVAAQELRGTVYRDKEGRRTLRFEHDGRGYFLKLHEGVGWKEILKNLVQARLPVLGAENEYRAIRALEHLGIDTLSVAAYGRRGSNPAAQISFLITDELRDVETLEDICARWPRQPPPPAFKRRLIERVAEIARRMHAAGINHRDFYLCHFLLENATQPGNAATANAADHRLYLMDLHRAQIRSRVPRRWLLKDLGGLYYSALDIGLNQRDILRFLRAYTQRPLREILDRDGAFWAAVRERARRIYVRDHRRAPSSPAWQRQPSLLQALRAGARELPGNATLPLAIDGKPTVFRVEAVLRLLPGKRVVLKGTLDDKTVIVKLFVRSASSARHIERERAGQARVSAVGVTCPALLGYAVTPCQKFEGLIYAFVADSRELSAVWAHADTGERRRRLHDIVNIMAALHRGGVYQTDIHADNFLLQGDTIFLLDMGSIEHASAPLERTRSLANLGELIAQFALNERKLFAVPLTDYFRQRGWDDARQLQGELQTAIDIAWQARKRDYMGKTRRDCTLTAYQSSWRQVRAYRRGADSDDLQRFFREPDAFMATGSVLKAGNTATVVKAALASTPVVIKRYNIKNWRHAISRALRPTRAEHSWRYAHLLELAGIASTRPIALLERRYGPLRSTAYFVCSWLDAPDLLATGQNRELNREELDHLQTLLISMRALRLSHGDFKANNLLLCADAIAVIDLDAMQEHADEQSWQRTFARDIARLQRNWPANSAITAQIGPVVTAVAPWFRKDR